MRGKATCSRLWRTSPKPLQDTALASPATGASGEGFAAPCPLVPDVAVLTWCGALCWETTQDSLGSLSCANPVPILTNCV